MVTQAVDHPHATTFPYVKMTMKVNTKRVMSTMVSLGP